MSQLELSNDMQDQDVSIYSIFNRFCNVCTDCIFILNSDGIEILNLLQPIPFERDTF